MRDHDIRSRLKRGETILLDGGTGSELQRRGVNVSKGTSAEGGAGAWSAPAVEDAPDILREIHADYLRVGAEIITANSYNTNRGQLAHAGLAHKMEEFSRRAIEIAREARDAVAPEAFAGPIGAYANIGYKRAITTEAPCFPETQYHGINIGENTPEHYAEYGREWRAMEAQIIGGCCATTPAHIAALAPVVGYEFGDIQNGRVTFAALDRVGQPFRMRLNATAVRVEHAGSPANADHVLVTYVQNGKAYRIKARGVVMATGGWINRYVVRDLPEEYCAAYEKFHKAPSRVASFSRLHSGNTSGRYAREWSRCSATQVRPAFRANKASINSSATCTGFTPIITTPIF